ncbi:MAG TPA: CPBP family intramembrane glutamic endopeptidase [Propionibacteriaceae bacterium]|nr:CPBP family intramembrane glutamic endopeptidase [Propionibacteriaceae bacterium]
MPDQKATSSSGRDGFAARHPLSMFLILVFGISWPVLSVPVLASRGLLPGGQLPVELFALAVTWFVLLPAALWVTAASEGRSAARALLARAFRWRLGAWWLVVLLALPATTAVVGLALGGSLTTQGMLPVLWRAGVSLVIAVVLIHLWEETVWAGFLQTRLERRHSLPVAALITSVPFAALHLPLLLLGKATRFDVLVGAAKLLVLAVAMRLLVGVFLRATGSLLAVGVLHGVYNACNNAGGLADGLLQGADQNLAAPIALVVVTAAVAGHLRSRRSRPQALKHQTAEQPDSLTLGGKK